MGEVKFSFLLIWTSVFLLYFLIATTYAEGQNDSVILAGTQIEGLKHFHREVCLAKLQTGLEDGTIPSNSTIFARDERGITMSDPQTPVLTLLGCEKVCGKEAGWYDDIGPRLSTWLIPVFILVSNMEVAPLDKRRYLMLLHLLGDPIDSLFSLLSKMEAWSRCYILAGDRNLATVLGGLEELVGFYTSPREVYDMIIENPLSDLSRLDQHIGRAAQQLADSRTDERLRTLLATVLYIYQLISAFIATVGGGNTTPPGGRIGITMFMTWIIPSILLSNAIGCFTSRRSCFDTLDSFVRSINSKTNLWTEIRRTVPELEKYTSVQQYFSSVPYSGAIYTYRPSKRLPYGSGPRTHSPWILLVLAMSPILISSIIASVILWRTPPIGINCRNLLIFSIVILILLSALLTWVFSLLGLRGAAHWYAVLIKDAFVAVPSIVLVFLATAGRFNSCKCWSGFYTLGVNARVPLNPVAQFVHFDQTIYPILVSVCLLLLILAFAAMMWVGWLGWNVMRWTEEERQEEWNRIQLSVV